MKQLWYEQEAKNWDEALPLGNGRLGAMIYGGMSKERIQVNEESIWYGGAENRDNPSMKEALPKIRELIFQGDIPAAENLMKLAMSGCPSNMRFYQTLGEILLDFSNFNEVSSYRRNLNLDSALHEVHFCGDDTWYTRQSFISHADDCLVMLIRANQPGQLSFQAHLERSLYFDGVGAAGENGIWLYGNLGRGGSEFAMMLKAYAQGGRVYVAGETLCVENADQVLLLFSGDSSYQASSKEKDQAFEKAWKYDNMSKGERFERQWQLALREMLFNRLTKTLDAAISNAPVADLWEELFSRHRKDYSSLFDRVTFSLAGDAQLEDQPIDKRLETVAARGTDLGLEQLYFDFGRYLLISCSRPGGLPATLQGLWNQDFLPPWGCKYTININTEMNYWPAESTNLSECHIPLFRLIQKMIPQGRRTAREMYGCRGFVAHHNTDIFGDTAPQDQWIPGTYWVMGAAWLCTHLWTHYEYTLDKEFLQEFFPVMCEAALFFLDFLVEKYGYLLTCPSVSPENTFLLPGGIKGANEAGVTMDNQILRDLFTQCIDAARELNLSDSSEISGAAERNRSILESIGITDAEAFLQELESAREKLRPTQIGSKGTLLEWRKDYEEWEPGHRHISHLYGLYPSDQITVDGTPQLAEAAKATLARRLANGGGHTGWSRAWIINHYAKLWDGDTAHENLRQLLASSTYSNLFDRHPPFQIDGNFGGTAAIAQMLVQSSKNRIILLPALPSIWQEGSMYGLRIKGNAQIDISWKQGELCQCTITAFSLLTAKVRLQEKTIPISLTAGESLHLTKANFI